MAKLRFVDLFAGAGGLAEGFREAGFAVLAGTDIDPDACATFALNFSEAETIWGDIRAPAVEERVLAAASQADVIVGGPPCQAFSQVRNHSRLIDDPRNSLYREFVAVVAAARPKAFVMENVPGLEQMGVKQQVISDLSLDGEYEVRVQALDAADFGVPQTRRRIVFVGMHRSLGKEPPSVQGTGATEALSLARRNGSYPIRYRVRASQRDPQFWIDRLADPEDASVVTAEQAIGDFSRLRPGTRSDALMLDAVPAPRSAYQQMMRKGVTDAVWNTSVPRINADTVLRLKGIPKGGNHRDLPDHLPGALPHRRALGPRRSGRRSSGGG